jgi:enamine deaminase RidA (YjgF/YER057c/UK114 family)
MDFDSRAIELGLELPAPVPAIGAYLKAVQSGNLLYLSGHGPHKDGAIHYRGKIGKELTLEEGYAAARLTMLNCLSSLRVALGTFNRVVRVVKVLGFVNSAPGFTDQPKVINGGSDLLIDLFGENGRHARSAIGVAELPSDIAVEIEMIVEIVEMVETAK